VKDATFANIARMVGRVADELGIEKATFLGHSLGGGVALHLALERPDLVQGLVLLAPAMLGYSMKGMTPSSARMLRYRRMSSIDASASSLAAAVA